MNMDKFRRQWRAEQMRSYLLSGGRAVGPGVVRVVDYKARKARQAIRESIERDLNTPEPGPHTVANNKPK
jgi:hypothetical protein